MDGAGLLWAHLEKQYGKPGIIAIYLEFKAAMDIRIGDNKDPLPLGTCDHLPSR